MCRVPVPPLLIAGLSGPRLPLMHVRSTGVVRSGAGQMPLPSLLGCGKWCGAAHSFLEIWHQDPEGFLPRVGMGWRNRPSRPAKGTVYTQSPEWEIFKTVFGIREPSRLTQVWCGYRGPAGKAGG